MVGKVLRHLGINAANPLTIITQDMARAFLSGEGLFVCVWGVYFGAKGREKGKVLRHLHNLLTIITQDMARAFLSESALSWQISHTHATFLCSLCSVRLL